MTPVVFVHGLRTSADIWAAQLEVATTHGHDAVAVDLPGHGSRSGERFTLTGALAAIDEAVGRFDVPPVLVGLSLGGYTCLAYAARNEAKIAGVLLSGCSTEIRGKPISAYRAVSLHVARTLRPRGHSWHVVADMLAAMRGYSSLTDLRRLSLPVWIVNGSRDILRMEEWRFRLAQPSARVHVVPRAGHDVNTHAPEAFNRLLLEVLDHRAAGGRPAHPERLRSRRPAAARRTGVIGGVAVLPALRAVRAVRVVRPAL